MHDLRHTHAALLIGEGVHQAIIASRLGHTRVKTVLDVYGHLYAGLDRDAADALDSLGTLLSGRVVVARQLLTRAFSGADGI